MNAILIINDEENETTVDAFVRDNIDTLDPEDVEQVCGLQPGERFNGGGGASPSWSLCILGSEPRL